MAADLKKSRLKTVKRRSIDNGICQQIHKNVSGGRSKIDLSYFPHCIKPWQLPDQRQLEVTTCIHPTFVKIILLIVSFYFINLDLSFFKLHNLKSFDKFTVMTIISI